MQKKILLINRHAPYGSSTAKEALDVALAAAVYDQDLSLLFMDDGGQKINQKKISSILSALPLYDINKIYIHQESLKQRKIEDKDLLIENATILTNEQVSILLNHQDHILSF